MAYSEGVSELDRKTALAVVLVVAIVYFVASLIYQLFFSPLSRIPGPWQTRISSIPEANAIKAQRRTKWINSLFEENPGAVAIRTAPRSVSFNHPDAIKAIYGIEPARMCFNVWEIAYRTVQVTANLPTDLAKPAGTMPSRRPANRFSRLAQRSDMP